RPAVCGARPWKASAPLRLSIAASFLTLPDRPAILSATVTRFLPGRRSLWAFGAVVLLCGAAARAAPAPHPGRRGKQSTKAETPREVPKEAPAPLDGGGWRLKSYRGADGNPVTPIDGDRPTIRFRAGRIITGSGGCNTFTARHTYDPGALTAG